MAATTLPRVNEVDSMRTGVKDEVDGTPEWPGVAGLHLEVLEEEEEDAQDTTAEHVRAGTRDFQGITWSSTPYTREDYRVIREQQYRTYFNREEEVLAAKPQLRKEALQVDSSAALFTFHRNWRKLRSTIVHFQLRNLLWCPTPTDMYTVYQNRVVGFNTCTRRASVVMDVGGGIGAPGAPGIGPAQVCTACVRYGLAAGGGFAGELVVRRLGAAEEFCHSGRVTESENGITNAIEIARGRSGATYVLCSNNDERVRILDASTFQTVRTHRLPWAVNTTVVQPGGRLLCSVGDDPDALVFDPGQRGTRAAVQLAGGHVDFSFAAAWHPDGNVLATGNQDCTTRLHDLRMPNRCLALLLSNGGAIRSLRFSDCGNFLAAAEPADFVTVFDASAGYRRSQLIDLFGELAGIAFVPGGSTLNIAVADLHYSSVIQYHKRRDSPLFM